MFEIGESNTIYSTKYDAHRKSFGIIQKCLRVIEQVTKHYLGLVVLIFAKSSGLLRAQQGVIKLAKETKVLAGGSGNQSVRPDLAAEFILFRA